MALQTISSSKTVKLTTPLTTPFHEQYRTTTNKDQHALIVIVFRLSVIKLVDVVPLFHQWWKSPPAQRIF
ncbi:hypothetical protein C9189_10005 [Escherichia coli]|nr:hypothetical protein AW064_17330 [Escherichia coli]TJE74694.1 hypothetical protein C9212_16680 [Escherichia coli]TJE80415.1 hypothetical protein C9208_11945 [Escherichia coli]TJE92793.1 hypothetical protein C9211_10370 [Escherichia coli]TJF85785.1 hypothetical protein C9189_10005 [Escherichia coli]